jgi:hypothetical protein
MAIQRWGLPLEDHRDVDLDVILDTSDQATLYDLNVGVALRDRGKVEVATTAAPPTGLVPRGQYRQSFSFEIHRRHTCTPFDTPSDGSTQSPA